MVVGGTLFAKCVGRDEELERLRALVGGVPEGPRGALVRGEPGFGKTLLWRHGIAAAEAAGAVVLATRCVEAETPIALGALTDILEAAFSDVADRLAEPQRRTIAAAIGLEDLPAVSPDAVTLPRAVVAALRLLAARSPVVVAVDDAQWLDAASRRVLAFALRRLAALPVGALITLRGGEATADPLDLVGAFGPEHVVTLDLGALTSGAMQHLLRARLGVRLRRPTLLRVHEASGGNPMFALEFARTLAAGDDPATGAPLAMPASLRDLVRERAAAFPAELRPLLELVATLERPTLSDLASAFGTEASQRLLARAQQVDAVTVGPDDVVRFTHPLLASSVYADATPQRRRALHAQAAELLADLEARAAHLAFAATGPDAAVAAVLGEAALRASRRGTPDAAAKFAEWAQALTPEPMAAERARRALDVARYLIDGAQVTRAVAALDALLAGDVTGRDRAEALQLRATVDEDAEFATELLERALEHTGDDALLRASILSHLAHHLALFRGDPAAAEVPAREAVASAERLGDPVALDAALRSLGQIAALRGEPYVHLLERAVELGAEPTASSAGSSRSVLGIHRCWSGDLAGARALLEEDLDAATRHGEKRRAFVLLRLAEVEWREGDLDAAERHVAEPAEVFLDGGDPWGSAQVLTVQALLAAIRGHEDESRRLVDEAITHERGHGNEHRAIANRWVLGFLELSLDRPAAAHELLAPLPGRLEALGIGEPGFVPVVPDAVEALIALGRPGEAETDLAGFERQATALRHRWAIPAARRCRALLLLASGNTALAFETARDAAAELAEAGFALDHGRALLVAGDALRRLGERRRAADRLEAAKEVFRGVGATLWLERAEQQLRRSSPRPRKDGELTSSERRVAALVVSGLTNREVAAQLFTTVSTVEAHLTRIYRKVGVRSRTVLARRVADGALHLDDA